MIHANPSNGSGNSSAQIYEGSIVHVWQPIFRLLDPSHIQVRAEINESQFAPIRPGQPVLIHLEAFPDRPLRGSVAGIVPVPSQASALFTDVRTFFATVRIESACFDALTTGLTAELEFLIETRRQVTRIPLEAIRWIDDQPFAAALIASDTGPDWQWQWRPDRAWAEQHNSRRGQERPETRRSRHRSLRRLAEPHHGNGGLAGLAANDSEEPMQKAAIARLQSTHRHGVGLTRRELLQVGYSGLLGIGIPSIWARQAASAPPPAAPVSKARSVLLIFLTGAPSHLDTFDLKPDAPVEIRGDFKPIATRVPGVEYCEHLPQLAARADKLAVIRSMTHGLPSHEHATHMMLTGVNVLPPGSTHMASRADWPCYASGLDFMRPRSDGVPNGIHLPTYLNNGYGFSGQNAGVLGSRFDPWHIKADPNEPGFRVAELSLPVGSDGGESRPSQGVACGDRPPVRRRRGEGRAEGLRRHSGQGVHDVDVERGEAGVRPRSRRPAAAGTIRPAHVRAIAAALASTDRGRRTDRASEHGPHEQLGYAHRQLQAAQHAVASHLWTRVFRHCWTTSRCGACWIKRWW